MHKKNAIMVAVILAILAIAIVAIVTSVFDDNSEERYGQISVPQTEVGVDKASMAMTESVEDEGATTEAREGAGDAISEPAVQEEQSETVAKESAQEATTENTSVASAQDESAAEGGSQSVTTASRESAPASVQDVPANAPAAEAEGGQIHVVTAQGLKFEPLVVKIQPGDTVAWENMSTHDTQSLEGLIPEGAEHWHSPMSENYQRTFTVEGIYIYKCTPHFGAGMGGVIIVGEPVNLEAIKAAEVKGAARRLVKKAIAAAEQM